MVTKKRFDTSLADSQSIRVKPLSYQLFDFDAYAEYAVGLEEKCRSYTIVDTAVLVYRRMRITEVFTYGCRNMKESLALQLGALQESMKFKADVPNFLEPWYGIGTIASAFGLEYSWPKGQAPVVTAKFKNVEEALQADFQPVEKTGIGIHTLNMIEYFLDKTKGKLPMSVCDSQSPLNIATSLVHVDDLPETFLNIRLSPVDIIKQTNDEIRETIVRLVSESGNPFLTGVCCINMDDQVSDDKVTTILKTVDDIRDNYLRDS